MLIESRPLGKLNYYAIRGEFQFRGSPHIYSFPWINATTLSEKSLDDYADFLDFVERGNFPLEEETRIFIIWLKIFKAFSFKNLP